MSASHPSAIEWRALEDSDLPALVAARNEAHWAAQILSAVGYSHVAPADDDSQSNLGWVDGMQILVGRRIEREPACFLSLSPARMALAIHEADGEVIEELDLAGKSLEDAHAWTEAAIGRRYKSAPKALVRPSYEMPAHELVDGAHFGAAPAEAREQLARWMHNANIAMRDLHAQETGSSGPRVWPHHFDMGILIELDSYGKRSIGIGMSPGDGFLAAPYWYVNPYPAPQTGLVEPEHGRWNREGWTGLILEAEELVAAADQESKCRHFLEQAVRICRTALED